MPYRLLDNTGFPVRLWGKNVEEQAQQQLRNVSALPHLFRHVAAMPDVHYGIGATVGTVLASTNMVIPAAVGVDIGCGVSAVRLPMTREWLMDGDRRQRIRRGIEHSIPVGFGQRTERQVSTAAEVWARKNLKRTRLQAPLGEKVLEKARLQLGTLGGGNHFIEVCHDEMGRVWVMLHSGSRHIGKQIADHYIKRAKERMKKAGRLSELPDPNLAHFTEGSSDFRDYLSDLYWAQDYARFNREEMMRSVLEEISLTAGEWVGKGSVQGLVQERVDCHHNYVAREIHFGRKVYVTRKGALSAKRGEAAVIPGSMGSPSYIVSGKGNPDSFQSCAHGAGRRMSRKEAKRRFAVEDLVRQTEGVECRKDKGVLDEIPQAYKDIDTVMAQQADLVEVRHRLRQVICVKG
ncbi:MAG: RtcB family protein [SAR324 cluster bacterium]|nr:RtcB family protein [SAR324 cluster bacterium]MCZ6629073.1 RtcB family protein [SAR324 cluster bacterium]